MLFPFSFTAYNNVNTPYYETTPIHTSAVIENVVCETPHIYEVPDGEENCPFSSEEKLPGYAVVDIGLQKDSMYKKTDASVKFTHRRSAPNKYEVSEIPGAQRSAPRDHAANMK